MQDTAVNECISFVDIEHGLLDVLIAADIGLIDFLKERDIYKGTIRKSKIKMDKSKKTCNYSK